MRSRSKPGSRPLPGASSFRVACTFVAEFALALALSMSFAGCGGTVYRPGEAELAEYAKAAERYAAGDFSAARDGAGALWKRAPSFEAAAVLAGKAALFSGDPRGAVALLERISADNREAAIWLVRALDAAGRLREADAAVERLLADDAGDWRLLELAARGRKAGGDEAAYRALLDRAIDAASGVGLALVERAGLRNAAGDRDGAARDLDAALAVLPADSAAGKAARLVRDELERRSQTDANAIAKGAKP